MDEWRFTMGERFLASTPAGVDWVPIVLFVFIGAVGLPDAQNATRAPTDEAVPS